MLQSREAGHRSKIAVSANPTSNAEGCVHRRYGCPRAWVAAELNDGRLILSLLDRSGNLHRCGAVWLKVTGLCGRPARGTRSCRFPTISCPGCGRGGSGQHAWLQKLTGRRIDILSSPSTLRFRVAREKRLRRVARSLAEEASR